MIVKSNFKYWKWKFAEDKTFRVGIRTSEPLEILSQSGNVMARLDGGILTIRRHYHFNGADYAPDFKKCLRGVAVHDALLQILEEHPGAFSKQEAHEAMHEIHRVDGFKLRFVYFLAVTMFNRD